MSKVRFEWNRKAFEQIRRDPKVLAFLDELAQEKAEAAGEGYESSSMQGKTRARSSVITATGKAMRDNAKNDTLLRVFSRG